jgi:hypothetical protein
MPESETESKPNHYSLHGHNVTIDYSLSDFTGQPSINFKVDQFAGTAQKDEIHVTQSGNVGLVITIALHPGPSADEGDPQFSFLLPEVTLDSGRETAFETIGFKTVITRKGPAHQRYTPVSLKGKASIVESIAAKA